MRICDWRDIANGRIIPTEEGGYCDQPSFVELSDGSWLCSVTTSSGAEGSTAQYVSIMKSRDEGKSWSEPERLEPMEDGAYWESSYSKLIVAKNGEKETVFCFYCYNDMHMKPEEALYPRVDMGISFSFRYSTDGGENWSDRKSIPVKDTLIDEIMPHFGKKGEKVPLFWNVSKVIVRDGAVYVPLTKIGNRNGFMSHGEGLLLRSENLIAEPEQAVWETLPEGKQGVTWIEDFDSVCEEHCYTFLSDESVLCTFRTAKGRAGCAVSHDGGRSFGKSELLRYPDGRAVKNTRANNTFWYIGEGKYLYWFTNCGHDGYYPRNPTWVCAAVEEDTPEGKQLKLAQPEILLYTKVAGSGFSYPDILVKEDRIYISETQKSIARIHEIPMSFVDDMFRQFDPQAKPKAIPDYELKSGKNIIKPLGKIYEYLHFKPDYTMSGLTFDFDIDFNGKAQIVFDNLDAKGEGILICVEKDGSVKAEIEETRETCTVKSECCLEEGRNRVSVVFDFVADTAYFVVNGLLLDGGDQKNCGWRQIKGELMSAGEFGAAVVGGCTEKLRIYKKALSVTECIIAHRVF
ncbi:MAG: exo-alpha-sialidase [Ruminococcaceae bacterium]|nr:exo-alpha-sialidase [Oscillospiraceae bacterium]